MKCGEIIFSSYDVYEMKFILRSFKEICFNGFCFYEFVRFCFYEFGVDVDFAFACFVEFTYPGIKF